MCLCVCCTVIIRPGGQIVCSADTTPAPHIKPHGIVFRRRIGFAPLFIAIATLARCSANPNALSNGGGWWGGWWVVVSKSGIKNASASESIFPVQRRIKYIASTNALSSIERAPHTYTHKTPRVSRKWWRAFFAFLYFVKTHTHTQASLTHSLGSR